MTTNIRHLMPDDPLVDLPAPARRLRDFLGSIIQAGTSDAGELVSAIPCRKRGCRGTIATRRQDLPSRAIHWHCSACEDGGIITNWEKTHFDLTPSVANKESVEDPWLEMRVSADEHAALRSGGIYDPDCERLIYGARTTLKGIVVRGLESDFDNFVGYVAADANHETKARRRKLLDAVFERASDMLENSMFSRGE